MPENAVKTDLFTLAEAAFRKDSFKKAEDLLEQLLENDQADHRALSLLADIWTRRDAPPLEPLGLMMLAVQAAPGERAYKEKFIALAEKAAAQVQFNPLLKATFTACLGTPGLDCAPAEQAWYRAFTTDPAFAGIFRTRRKGLLRNGRTTFDPAAFDACADFAPLLDPFFLGAVEKITVYRLPFEEFLTHLRAAMLAQPGRFSFPLAAALSHYCFRTEYIFNVSTDETQKLAALRARVASGAASETEIAVYACYAPLYELDIKAPAALQGPVAEYQSLVRRSESITALTPISEGVSSAVRAQYEQFPYPRWHAPGELNAADLYHTLRGKAAKVLVAGGGTGQEAAAIARALPDAAILSIDLSRMSLAYAAQKAEAFGLGNITFRHADILKLDTHSETYDAISASGVLHHMEDPMRGWRILTKLLKPGGIMNVALYSEAARGAVVRARAAIAKGNYPATADGMRAFRRDIEKKLSKEDIGTLQRFADFFQMSMFRDLLFHVQEHRFTVPQIAAALDELGLEFIKFLTPRHIKEQYNALYPAGETLKDWTAFEAQNPDAFLYMYQMWCRKKP